jgi:hypothetical protein
MAAGAWTFPDASRAKLLDGTFDVADDTFKMALFLSTSNLGSATTTYAGVTNEHANANGYTTGGIAVDLTVAGTTTVTVDIGRVHRGPLRGHLRGRRGRALLLLARLHAGQRHRHDREHVDRGRACLGRLHPRMIWGVRYGRWWMIQWVLDGWFSLGVHVDLKHRSRNDGLTFGPYIDLHLGVVVVSVGNNPAYSTDLERCLSVSRGGLVE